MRPTGLPLEKRRRVVGQQRERGEVARDLHAGARDLERQIARRAGLGECVEDPLHAGARRPQRLDRRVGQRPDQRVGDPVVLRLVVGVAGARGRRRAPPSVIDIITEISAMPSPMQWWMRAISALPPS